MTTLREICERHEAPIICVWEETQETYGSSRECWFTANVRGAYDAAESWAFGRLRRMGAISVSIRLRDSKGRQDVIAIWDHGDLPENYERDLRDWEQTQVAQLSVSPRARRILDL